MHAAWVRIPYWFAHELPYLVCPMDGKHIQLQLDNFVPRLPRYLDEMTVQLGFREVRVPWALSIAAPAFPETDRSGAAEPGDEVCESSSDDSEELADDAGAAPREEGAEPLGSSGREPVGAEGEAPKKNLQIPVMRKKMAPQERGRPSH